MNRSRILLVEDNPDDVALTLRAFASRSLDGEIIVARDGAEALSLLFPGLEDDGEPLNPEVVLLDLKLPKVDGFEVLRRIRADERTRRVPVVVLSSSAAGADIRASYDCGANSYVRKPVDFLEFSETLQRMGTYWLHLNLSGSGRN